MWSMGLQRVGHDWVTEVNWGLLCSGPWSQNQSGWALPTTQNSPAQLSSSKGGQTFWPERVDPVVAFLWFHSHSLIFLWYFLKENFWVSYSPWLIDPLPYMDDWDHLSFQKHAAASVRLPWLGRNGTLTFRTHQGGNTPDSPANWVRTLAAAVVIKPLSSPEWKPFPDKYPGSRSLLPCIGVPCG